MITSGLLSGGKNRCKNFIQLVQSCCCTDNFFVSIGSQILNPPPPHVDVVIAIRSLHCELCDPLHGTLFIFVRLHTVGVRQNMSK